MIRFPAAGEQAEKCRRKYAEVAQPDFEKLAVGFGAKCFRVDRPGDFGESVARTPGEKGRLYQVRTKIAVV